MRAAMGLTGAELTCCGDGADGANSANSANEPSAYLTSPYLTVPHRTQTGA